MIVLWHSVFWYFSSLFFGLPSKWLRIDRIAKDRMNIIESHSDNFIDDVMTNRRNNNLLHEKKKRAHRKHVVVSSLKRQTKASVSLNKHLCVHHETQASLSLHTK